MKEHLAPISDIDAELKLKGFKVSGIGGNNKITLVYNRKDFSNAG